MAASSVISLHGLIHKTSDVHQTFVDGSKCFVGRIFETCGENRSSLFEWTWPLKVLVRLKKLVKKQPWNDPWIAVVQQLSLVCAGCRLRWISNWQNSCWLNILVLCPDAALSLADSTTAFGLDFYWPCWSSHWSSGLHSKNSNARRMGQ